MSRAYNLGRCNVVAAGLVLLGIMGFLYKSITLLIIFRDFIYLVLERGEGREKERNIDMRERRPSAVSRVRPDWDLP